MPYLKYDGGETITKHVNFHEEQTRTLISQTTLDGVEHLMRYGRPVRSIPCDTYVTGAGKTALENAADSLALLELSGKNGTFTVRIKSLGAFKRLPGGYFQTQIVFAVVSEVTA